MDKCSVSCCKQRNWGMAVFLIYIICKTLECFKCQKWFSTKEINFDILKSGIILHFSINNALRRFKSDCSW